MTKTEVIEWLEKAKAETTAIAKDIPTTEEYANSLITAIELVDALNMAIEALEQEPIIHCKECKHWHEWENGTGACHRSNSIWVGTDYDDYCSFAEQKESDEE